MIVENYERTAAMISQKSNDASEVATGLTLIWVWLSPTFRGKNIFFSINLFRKRLKTATNPFRFARRARALRPISGQVGRSFGMTDGL